MHNGALPASLKPHIGQHFSQLLQGDSQAKKFPYQIHPKYYIYIYIFFLCWLHSFSLAFPFPTTHKTPSLLLPASWQQRPPQMTACGPPQPGHTLRIKPPPSRHSERRKRGAEWNSRLPPGCAHR